MKYKKKPVVIEAIQWTGNNLQEIHDFVDDFMIGTEQTFDEHIILIDTLEGLMKASTGDFIIKGIKGEFYPCKPDIFEQTYEKLG